MARSSVVVEEALARRIKGEREVRGWSPAGLASRMTAAGCPMGQSAIWKIENGNPRRRITLDEAITFAKVFEIGLEELTLSPEVRAAEDAKLSVEYIRSGLETIADANNQIAGAWLRLARLLREDTTGLVLGAALLATSDTFDPWSSTVDERIAAAEEAATDLDGAKLLLSEWMDATDKKWREITTVTEEALDAEASGKQV